MKNIFSSLAKTNKGQAGGAYMAIAGIVGIVLMLYFVPMIISSIQNATGTGLSTSMTVAQSYLNNNTTTSVNLMSLYPVVAVAGLMIAAFLGFMFVRQ